MFDWRDLNNEVMLFAWYMLVEIVQFFQSLFHQIRGFYLWSDSCSAAFWQNLAHSSLFFLWMWSGFYMGTLQKNT